jgi:hypothetical protein
MFLEYSNHESLIIRSPHAVSHLKSSHLLFWSARVFSFYSFFEKDFIYSALCSLKNSLSFCELLNCNVFEK